MPIKRAEEPTPEHVCSRCGHREPIRPFVFPSASLHISGESRHYEVQIPGEEAPRRFDREPSREAIKAILDEKQAQAEAQEEPPVRRRRRSEVEA